MLSLHIYIKKICVGRAPSVGFRSSWKNVAIANSLESYLGVFLFPRAQLILMPCSVLSIRHNTLDITLCCSSLKPLPTLSHGPAPAYHFLHASDSLLWKKHPTHFFCMEYFLLLLHCSKSSWLDFSKSSPKLYKPSLTNFLFIFFAFSSLDFAFFFT